MPEMVGHPLVAVDGHSGPKRRAVDKAFGPVAAAELRAPSLRVAKRGRALTVFHLAALFVVEVGIPPTTVSGAEAKKPLGRIAEGRAMGAAEAGRLMAFDIPSRHLRLTLSVSHVDIACILVLDTPQRLAGPFPGRKSRRAKGSNPAAVCSHASSAGAPQGPLTCLSVALTRSCSCISLQNPIKSTPCAAW